MAGRPLMPIRQLLCASPQYLAAMAGPAIRASWRNICACIWPSMRGQALAAAAWQRATERGSQGRYATNHSELRLQGVLAHLGIAPCHTVPRRRRWSRAD
jgi:DNA-binding transcriptional LysR family regulator